MKIAIPGQTYTAADGPIAVVLTPADRENIARMPADATIYCATPGDADVEAVDRWLETLKDAGDPSVPLTILTHLDATGAVVEVAEEVGAKEQARRLKLFQGRSARREDA